MLWLLVIWSHPSARGAQSIRTTVVPEDQTVTFRVYWPPQNPAAANEPKTRALLNGSVNLDVQNLVATGWVATIRIILSRPADDAGREFWNSRLAFPEYDWMSYVRVWDPEHRWLWPNLAYLLRLHGRERVDRYGGVDPGKGVDNDFAAVLIREYDDPGETESQGTQKAPLVSAEWHSVGVVKVDRQTVVHTAQSDQFTLHLGMPGEGSSGKARIWLIYADFLGAPPPTGWPKEPEYAGGILAFFQLRWAKGAAGPPEIRIEQTAPRRATGFDWERWTRRTLSAPDTHSTAKLTDFGLPGQPGRAPEKVEQRGTANQSPPVRQETNQPSEAAGSGR